MLALRGGAYTLGGTQSVVEAMLQDAEQHEAGGAAVEVAGEQGGSGNARGAETEEQGEERVQLHNEDMRDGSEWPTDSSAPEKVIARNSEEGEWPTDSSAIEKVKAAGAASDCLHEAEQPGSPDDDAWIEAGGYPRELKHLVQLDRAISATFAPAQAESCETVLDSWTRQLHHAALMYERATVESLVSQARRERGLHPGSPLQVQLPGSERKTVDASSMTSGQLIEQILTNGNPLDRDARGRVIVPREFRSRDNAEGSGGGCLERILAYEPFRSLVSHHVVDGLDFYSEDVVDGLDFYSEDDAEAPDSGTDNAVVDDMSKDSEVGDDDEPSSGDRKSVAGSRAEGLEEKKDLNLAVNEECEAPGSPSHSGTRPGMHAKRAL